MRFSRTFRVAFINKKFPNWYKEMALKEIVEVNKEVDRLLDEMSFEAELTRVYIPKTTPGKFRPLGVPSKPWRLLGGM